MSISIDNGKVIARAPTTGRLRYWMTRSSGSQLLFIG